MLNNTKILDNTQLQSLAPSIFAESPFVRMSEKYKFIPTIQVLDGLRDNGFLPTKAMQSRTRIPGKADFTKHLIRLRHKDYLQVNVQEEVPEIVLINSHDGSSAYQLMSGIFRLVCSNGMIVQSADTGQVSVRHSGQGDIVQDVIDASFEIVEEMPKHFEKIQDFKNVQLNPMQQLAFAKSALELKSEKAAETFRAESLLIPRRWEDRGANQNSRDLWKTMNTVQEHMMRGGIRGRNSTGRRTTTRAVKSVSEDIRINKALWTLTEAMAGLAKAA